MILAGDIGGTKTLIGLFDFHKQRPVPVDIRSFPTTAYPSLSAIIEEFYLTQKRRPPITAAAFGIAGPVINQNAQMTNVTWCVDAAELTSSFAFPNVRLLNDLEATAYGVSVLEPHELKTLQSGGRNIEGNMAVIAAGTGLGGSVLHYLGGRHTPLASEVGHSDFAARTDRDIDFLRFIRARARRAEIEHVLSGPGLVNLADFTHQHERCPVMAHTDAPARPADVSKAALAGTCPRCVEAMEMFTEAYGAVAGNLALTAVTTGGVFLGGGIAPRILPALETGRFIQAFNDKEPMRALLEAMPVHVILNAQTGLVGAAVYANTAWS